MSYTANSRAQVSHLNPIFNALGMGIGAGAACLVGAGKLASKIIADMIQISKELNSEKVFSIGNLICQELQKSQPNIELIKNQTSKLQKETFFAFAKQSCIEMGFGNIEVVSDNKIFFLNEEGEKGLLLNIEEDKDKGELNITSEAVGYPHPECKKIQEKFYKKIKEKGIILKNLELKKTRFPMILNKIKNSFKRKSKIKHREVMK